MIIKIKVYPKSKEEKVIERDGIWKVYVKSPAEKGKANRDVIEVLSNFFKVSKNKIKIIKGETSREKIVEIEG